MGSFFSGLVTWLLGKLFGPKEPTTADLAAQAATAQTSLSQERAANEVLLKGAAARAAADAQRVRYDPNANVIHADRSAAVNLGIDDQPDPDIRD